MFWKQWPDDEQLYLGVTLTLVLGIGLGIVAYVTAINCIFQQVCLPVSSAPPAVAIVSPTAAVTTLAVMTPAAMATRIISPTASPTTAASATPTAANTATATATTTNTPTPSPTATPGATATNTPTATPTATATATNTATPAPTATAQPTNTPRPTTIPSPTATATPRPTATPQPTLTATPAAPALPTQQPLLPIDDGTARWVVVSGRYATLDAAEADRARLFAAGYAVTIFQRAAGFETAIADLESELVARNLRRVLAASLRPEATIARQDVWCPLPDARPAFIACGN